MKPQTRLLLLPMYCGALISLSTCGDDDSNSDSSTAGAGSGGSVTAGTGGSSTAGSSGSFDSSACTAKTTDIDKVICASNAFLGTLSGTQLSSIQLEFSDSTSRTKWSNLPGAARAGLKMGDLSTTTQQAALAMMQTVLSDAGVSDLTGVRAADDYLGAQGSSGGGMMMGGGAYSSNNYYVAILGTPSATNNWEIMFGGHHMAYNITFIAGTGYPVPNHLGVEPKSRFTVNGSSYEPLSDEGSAIVALFKSLSTADLDAAYLNDQVFADVLIGPLEYGKSGEDLVKSKYPNGSGRTGVKVSTLTAEQRALVKTALDAWVGDYNESISGALLDAYTSDEAYGDTLLAWGGTKASGVDVDLDKTYMRIDGPRAWIEVSCQAGVVIQGQTHYHTIFRDKTYDYGGTL